MFFLNLIFVVTLLITSSKADVDPDCLGDQQYWPDIYDCAKYYECNAANIKVEMDCAEGTLWNQLLETCDRPENVDCSWTITPTEVTTQLSTTETPITTEAPTEPAPPSVTTESPTQTPTVDPSLTCDTELEYFADPYDCQGFYQCLNGVKQHDECPDPLLWDVQITGCSVSSDCSQLVSTTSQSTKAPTTAKPYLCDNGDLTADTLDCQRFYYCQDNKWSGPLQCPADLYWSEAKKGCVVLEDSDCDLS